MVRLVVVWRTTADPDGRTVRTVSWMLHLDGLKRKLDAMLLGMNWKPKGNGGVSLNQRIQQIASRKQKLHRFDEDE